jgi:hypothetical protein
LLGRVDFALDLLDERFRGGFWRRLVEEDLLPQFP